MLWETSLTHLEKSLQRWQAMIGEEENEKLQLTTEKELGKDPESPKHGKVDPTGAPHVGGNTWAGGTGKDLFLNIIRFARNRHRIKKN